MIFDEIAELMESQMEKKTAAQIAAMFNRERKSIYFWRCGCAFRCDIDFVCGLNKLGYDIKLVKITQA